MGSLEEYEAKRRRIRTRISEIGLPELPALIAEPPPSSTAMAGRVATAVFVCLCATVSVCVDATDQLLPEG